MWGSETIIYDNVEDDDGEDGDGEDDDIDEIIMLMVRMMR